MSSSDCQEWFDLLKSKKRLDRERALNQLRSLVTPKRLDEASDFKTSIESKILEVILSLATPWEERQGGLLAAGIMIQAAVASEHFCETIKGVIQLYLEDPESRVRMAAGQDP